MTKYCSNCGEKIKDNARFCEKCGNDFSKDNIVQKSRKPRKKRGCLMSILIFIILGIGTVFFAAMQNDSIQKSVSGVSDNSEYITLEEYNKIETGMTYEEVAEIIGSKGTVSSQVEMNGINNTIITWYGNGVAGSNANVTFINNEVQGKAQVGLK